MATTFEILCGCLVILILLYYYFTVNFDYWKSCGVNGPKPIPFFGNILHHFLGRISVGDFLKKIYDEYPEESMVGFYYYGEPALVLRNPEYIKHVLIKDFSSFPDRNFSVHEKAEPLSLHLFRIEAARWRPLRIRLSPIFTSGKLKDMFHLLLECSQHFERYLNEIVPEEGIVECRELTAKFTIDVIGSCAFGIEMNALNSKDNEFYKLGRRIFRGDLKVIIRERWKRAFPWLYEHFGNIMDDHDVTNFMLNLIRETTDYRKQNNVYRPDFIQLLMNLKNNPDNLDVTDILIAAQLHVFFAAGFETSSTTISNAMYELAQYPLIQEKVREDIKEVLSNSDGAILYDDIKKMTYLDMVFQETLRKYPPVAYLARRATTNYTFEGTKATVSKGQIVYIPIYGIQRDPNIFPNPDVFDPERFSAENVKLRNPMYNLPFGTGPRNCIGARFAQYQSKVGLIKILMNYKIDICEKTQIPYINRPTSALMLQPNHGIYVKLIKLDK